MKIISTLTKKMV